MDESNKRKRYDKDLKRARERLSSPKTQAAITEGVLAVAGATIFDAEQIIKQVGQRKDQYKHLDGKDFRSQVVEWAARQAKLTVRLRQMLPQIPASSGTVGTMLFLRLPDFEGTEEQLAEWATVTAKREREGAEQLVAWIAEHRQAVRRGIRKVLRYCMDLGVNDLWPNEDKNAGEAYPLDELESQVWREVVYDTDTMLSSEQPIGEQLYWRGYWAAFAWKKSRLREKETLHEDIIVGLGGLERETDEEGDVDVSLEDVAHHSMTNPLIERVMLWNGQDAEHRWTLLDLQRDLRNAGPFSLHDAYEGLAVEMMPIAA